MLARSIGLTHAVARAPREGAKVAAALELCQMRLRLHVDEGGALLAVPQYERKKAPMLDLLERSSECACAKAVYSCCNGPMHDAEHASKGAVVPLSKAFGGLTTSPQPT